MKDAGSFWARRRAAVEAEAEADIRFKQAQQEDARAQTLADKGDAEILEEMGLPDPMEMQTGDDFSAFMARDVPEHLRRQALRTLWRSNPVLACVDGLNDYDDDYRAAALLQEPVKTAYQVGKGMLKHIEEMERQASAKSALEEADQAVEASDPVSAIATEVEEDDTELATADAASGSSAFSAEYEESFDAPTPRRMRFRFEEATA